MKRIFALFAIAAAMFSSSVSASASPFDAIPFYGTLSGNSSTMNLSRPGVSGFEKTSTGFGVGVGAQVRPNIAVEFNFNDYGNRTTGLPYFGQTYREPVDLSDVGLHLVVANQVTDSIRVYIKPGIIQSDVHTFGYTMRNTSKAEVTIGAGVEYAVHPVVGIFAAVGRTGDFAGSGAPLTVASFGVRIHH